MGCASNIISDGYRKNSYNYTSYTMRQAINFFSYSDSKLLGHFIHANASNDVTLTIMSDYDVGTDATASFDVSITES